MITSVASCRRWRLRLPSLFIGIAAVGGCRAASADVWMSAGGQRFAVTLADTEAARSFASRLPMKLDMSDLNDNEKKFDLPKHLPANPVRPGTIRNGDLMLWGDNTVVLFYRTFDSPYPYTRLGQMSDPTGLAQALGRGDVRVQFSAQP